MKCNKRTDTKKMIGGTVRYVKGLLVVALVMFLGSIAMGFTGTYVPGSGINGTPHDLSQVLKGAGTGLGAYASNPADPYSRICIFCHTPHNAYKLSAANGGPGPGVGGGLDAPDAFDYLPLWNHELPINTAYTPYQNGPGAPSDPTAPKTSQAIYNSVMTIGSSSLLCLSCHDGTIAVNSYGSAAWHPAGSFSTGTVGALMGGPYTVGKDKYLGNHTRSVSTITMLLLLIPRLLR